MIIFFTITILLVAVTVLFYTKEETNYIEKETNYEVKLQKSCGEIFQILEWLFENINLDNWKIPNHTEKMFALKATSSKELFDKYKSLKDNLKSNSHYFQQDCLLKISFNNEQDALLFKLVWS